MELIVAVYDDWGIGREGTQPIALSADRKFFRRPPGEPRLLLADVPSRIFRGKSPCPAG